DGGDDHRPETSLNCRGGWPCWCHGMARNGSSSTAALGCVVFAMAKGSRPWARPTKPHSQEWLCYPNLLRIAFFSPLFISSAYNSPMRKHQAQLIVFLIAGLL